MEQRIINLSGSGIKLGSEAVAIGSFYGEVLVARSERVPLRIEKFEWKVEGLETEPRDGGLTVTGVCQPAVSQIELYQPTEITIIPNPAEDEIEITVRGEQGAIHTMEITNTLGISLEHIRIKLEGNEIKFKEAVEGLSIGCVSRPHRK